MEEELPNEKEPEAVGSIDQSTQDIAESSEQKYGSKDEVWQKIKSDQIYSQLFS
jgi:hypothetical protein